MTDGKVPRIFTFDNYIANTMLYNNHFWLNWLSSTKILNKYTNLQVK